MPECLPQLYVCGATTVGGNVNYLRINSGASTGGALGGPSPMVVLAIVNRGAEQAYE